MSIVKMKHVRFEGKRDKLNETARFVAACSLVHLSDSLKEIRSQNASETEFENYEADIHHEKEENIISYFENVGHKAFDATTGGFNLLENDEPLKDVLRRHGLENDIKVDKFSYDYSEIFDLIEKSGEEIKPTFMNITDIDSEVDKRSHLLSELEYFSQSDFDLGVLTSLEEFSSSAVLISKASYKKLKENYENIDIVVLKAGDFGENVLLVAFYLKNQKKQFERVFASLNYKTVDVPLGYKGTYEDIKETINIEIENLEKMKKELSAPIDKFFSENGDLLELAGYLLALEETSDKVKASSAVNEENFVITGYVPSTRAAKLHKEFMTLLASQGVALSIEDISRDDPSMNPPTKVVTSKIFSPFKMMINMYDTPSYYESDPTVFFALSYMLFFGAMFGDVGQGLVIFLIGLFVSLKMKKKDFGGVLSRLGVASVVFGFLYGSVFGSEEILKPILVRPMANITTVLIGAIVLGAVILSIAYIIGIINQFKLHLYEEAYFGREGIAGMGFFLSFLLLVISLFTDYSPISTALSAIICLVFLFLIILREPIYNLISKKGTLFNDTAGSYLLEEGFGSVETVLSVLSNSISFIRVGAFALNHAGLYLAFSSLAGMASSAVASTLILVLGNVIIIGMEGLIVFIQSMRLEYYELFSKYFHGEGTKYAPVKVGKN